jgi:hypothetical protein
MENRVFLRKREGWGFFVMVFMLVLVDFWPKLLFSFAFVG